MADRALSRRALLVAGLGGAAAFVPGCGSVPVAAEAPPSSSTPSPSDAAPAASDSSTAGRVNGPPVGPPTAARPASPPPPDPAKVKANELGVVPVLMYHRLSDRPGEYDMTPSAFRRQLRRLLHSGYRPVDTRDLARGEIDVPAGTTPVVLTFDDSSPGQFRLRSDGRVDPACAAGIITAECGKVPGARPSATFYLNQAPFGLVSRREQTRALRALLDGGFSLGTHSLTHPNLATLSDAAVAREFVGLQRLVERVVPDADLDTMALPFGVMPRNRRLAHQGSWDHTDYRFAITLLVGANPSPSPFAAAFDPQAVPRIRGTSWHGGHTPLTGTPWLDHLDAHPEERYVSAGRPGHVTVPRALRAQVAARYRHRVLTY